MSAQTIQRPSLREEFRLELRDRALDGAAAAVLEHGWERVRLAELARQTGLSRATLHRQFGGRIGLGQALLAREAHRVLAETVGALHQAPTWDAGIRAAVGTTLRAAKDRPLLAAVLEAQHGDTSLLPLLTTRSGPIIVEARRMLTRYLREHHPRQSPSYLADVADTLVRATLSQLATPDVEEAAADRLHRLATHLLPSPSSRAAPRSRLSG
jgi:AcrR family transcriptional regulator